MPERACRRGKDKIGGETEFQARLLQKNQLGRSRACLDS